MRRQVRRKVAEKWISEASERMTIRIDKISTAEVISLDPQTILVVNNIPLMVIDQGRNLYIPLIPRVGVEILCPSITVDMGAVPYLVKGADVMVPGIVSSEAFDRGDIIAVKTEKHDKVIAVGRALMSSQEIETSKKGKAVENLHYVGDQYWKEIEAL